MILNRPFPEIILRILAVITALSVHEMAHGLVSYWLGDKSAKRAGRLSLNPLAHIDWIGFLCLLLFGFGWAKPVPIDPRYYKDPKWGIIATSAAGPISNFLLSFLCICIFVPMYVFASGFVSSLIGSWIWSYLSQTCMLSLGFGVFNLIPIPPLDGAKIFWSFLPDQYYYRYMNGSVYTWAVLMVLIYTNVLTGLMGRIMQALYTGMTSIVIWFITLF